MISKSTNNTASECTFFDEMKGDLTCDRDALEGMDVCARHDLSGNKNEVPADD